MVDGVKRIIWATIVVVLTLLVAVFFRQPHRQPLKQFSPAQSFGGQSFGGQSAGMSTTGGQVTAEPATGSPLQLRTPPRYEQTGVILPSEELPLERRGKAGAIRSQSRIESEPPRAARTQGGELPPAFDERYEPLGDDVPSPAAPSVGIPASVP